MLSALCTCAQEVPEEVQREHGDGGASLARSAIDWQSICGTSSAGTRLPTDLTWWSILTEFEEKEAVCVRGGLFSHCRS